MDFYVPLLAIYVGAIVNMRDEKCKRKSRSSSVRSIHTSGECTISSWIVK